MTREQLLARIYCGAIVFILFGAFVVTYGWLFTVAVWGGALLLASAIIWIIKRW